jgi:branched-chain amino acid transport system permease protein
LATIVERTAAPGFVAAALKESAAAAAVAFLLAFPLLGFHLADIPGGVTVEARWSWVAIAAVAVFAGRFLLVLLRRAHPERFLKAFSFSVPRPSNIALNDIIGGLLAAFALALPFLPFSDRYIIDISISVLIYVMLGWGLNIVVGLAGLLDLGYVAFYAVGAYSFALLSQNFDLSFWVCLPLAGAFAASFGILLGFPVLRLRGDYLAIVTLGFGEMIRIILLNWQSFTGGPNGLSQIPRPSFFGFPFTRNPPEGVTAFHELFGIEFDVMHRTYFLYYVILILALLTNFFSMRIRKLPVGRAWEALREDEIACRSLGINPTNTKLSAFAIGAMFGGFAGSFFAARQGFISPESFTFPESATILAIVVLGGLGSQLGVVVAAAFLVLAPEFLRDFAQFRMLAFGAAMVAVMVWRPQGLVSHRDPSITLRPASGSAP